MKFYFYGRKNRMKVEGPSISLRHKLYFFFMFVFVFVLRMLRIKLNLYFKKKSFEQEIFKIIKSTKILIISYYCSII